LAEFFAMAEGDLRWQVKHAVVDVVMGVLARHAGSTIENDADLPVAPLAPRTSEAW
jgi:hypothetical protein